MKSAKPTRTAANKPKNITTTDAVAPGQDQPRAIPGAQRGKSFSRDPSRRVLKPSSSPPKNPQQPFRDLLASVGPPPFHLSLDAVLSNEAIGTIGPHISFSTVRIAFN